MSLMNFWQNKTNFTRKPRYWKNREKIQTWTQTVKYSFKCCSSGAWRNWTGADVHHTLDYEYVCEMTHSAPHGTGWKNFNCIWQQYNSVYDKLDLWTFQYTDHYGQHWEIDTDLGNHFCSNISDNCCYCSDEQFNHTWIKNDQYSF